MLEDQTLHQSSSSGSSKPHSVKVPRLYKVAANILRDFDDGKDSIKNLVFNCRYYSDGLRFFFTISRNTLKFLFTTMISMKVSYSLTKF